jgi:S-adenosylmethionine hydrolase
MTITLTTDFGARDGYVGAMKGVLHRYLRYVPQRLVVDVAHDLPRGDIAHAAWVVRTACFEFPEDTIHVVVVDPGVGGARQGVIVEAGGHTFVGPDNGVFAYVPKGRAFAIDLDKVRALSSGFVISPTFHGRDVFAPVAGALAQGKKPASLGAKTTLAGKLPWGERSRGEGRVVHIDHFGNLVTDLLPEEAGKTVEIAGHRLGVARTYEDVPSGSLLAYVGSAGTIEVAVRDGRADAALEAPRGTRIAPAKSRPYR